MQQLGDPLELRHRAMAALQGSEDTLTLLSERLPVLQRNAAVRPNPGLLSKPQVAPRCSRCAASPHPHSTPPHVLVLEDPRFSPAVSRVC